MPSYSRRDRNNNASGPSSSTEASATNASTENENRSNSGRSWWESVASWFGGGPDREEDRVEVESTMTEEEISTVESEVTVAPEESLPSILEEAVGDTVMKEQAPERVRERSDDVDQVTLTEGGFHTLTAEEAAAGWTALARDNGMHESKLMAFNQHIVQVDGGETFHTSTEEFVAGATIYIPSSDELVFAECRQKAGSYEEAITLYGTLAEGPNVKMMSEAQSRASGTIGEAYGTGGIEGGRFLTENPDIAGASSRRTIEVDGRTQYKVFWLESFWKCSIFMNDVAFSAGYEPALMGNKHYSVAGRAHQQKQYTNVDVANAAPGDAWQRFGGTGSDESHNAILSSFVTVEDSPLGPDYEQWKFSIIGAETDRAAESLRTHQMKRGTNENTQGKIIRFLRPNTKRSTDTTSG